MMADRFDPNGPEFQLGQTLHQLQALRADIARGAFGTARLLACLDEFAALIANVGLLRAECSRRGDLLREAARHVWQANKVLEDPPQPQPLRWETNLPALLAAKHQDLPAHREHRPLAAYLEGAARIGVTIWTAEGLTWAIYRNCDSCLQGRYATPGEVQSALLDLEKDSLVRRFRSTEEAQEKP